MRLVFITIVTTMIAACSEPVVELEGTVNGKKGYGGAAHWGGPHVLFTSNTISCQEVDWVQTNYGQDSVDLMTDASFNALQVTFRNTDVVEGETPIMTSAPPANAWFIESDAGTAALTPASTGTIDVEFDGDWLIGDIDIDFGASGSISGSFEIQSCVNLKSIEN